MKYHPSKEKQMMKRCKGWAEPGYKGNGAVPMRQIGEPM